MAKKSFKDNPALQFISAADEEQPEQTEQTVAQQTSATDPAPAGYKLNPLYLEKKSKRLQLLIQPSLYNKIKARADREGKSVNELIHSILEDETRKEQ